MRGRSSHFNYLILISTIILVIVGFMVLTSASSALGVKKFDSGFFYVRHQAINGFLPGIIGFFFTLFFYYKNYKKWAIIFLIISIGLLALVFTPLGTTTGSGATRWINIGNLTFQPAEIVKLTFIIYMAAWLTKKPSLLPFLAINGVIAALILLQPSLSNAIIIIASVLVMYIVSGAEWKHVGMIIAVGLILLSIFLLIRGGYQMERIMTYISALFGNADDFSRTTDYQRTWSVIAIGSGGWSGVGFGNSSIKNGPLPEAIGDSIFAVFAQEFGFGGVLMLTALFLALILGGFFLAKKIPDKFGKLLIVGIMSVIGIQAFVNMAALSGLIPVTGVPLPFISYGGTAFATFLTGIGIVLNVSKHGK